MNDYREYDKVMYKTGMRRFYSSKLEYIQNVNCMVYPIF